MAGKLGAGEVVRVATPTSAFPVRRLYHDKRALG